MTVPVFVEDFPEWVLQDGYSESLADGRIRTNMERGPPKVRRASTGAAKPVSGSAIADPNQTAAFERFWIEDTASGSLPFYFRDPRNDGLTLLDEDGEEITDEDGNPLLQESWWLTLFNDAPQIAPSGGLYYRVSFTLLVLP